MWYTVKIGRASLRLVWQMDQRNLDRDNSSINALEESCFIYTKNTYTEFLILVATDKQHTCCTFLITYSMSVAHAVQQKDTTQKVSKDRLSMVRMFPSDGMYCVLSTVFFSRQYLWYTRYTSQMMCVSVGRVFSVINCLKLSVLWSCCLSDQLHLACWQAREAVEAGDPAVHVLRGAERTGGHVRFLCGLSILQIFSNDPIVL